MDSIIQRLFNWYIGEKAPPEMVQIYPTNKCNLRCIFCVQRLNIYNLKEEVSKKRFLEVIEELCKMGVKKFLISGGGEPLSTPDKTLAIMKLIKSYGGQGRMITNGVLFNTKLIKEIIDMKWDNIMISLHGANEKTHDYLVGVKGTFNKVIENIRNFNKYKELKDSDLPFLEFTVVLNKLNFKEIPEIIELAANLNIKSVNVEPLCINNEMAKKIKLSKEERKLFFKKILPKAEKLARKLKIRTNFSRIKEVKYIEKAGKLKEEILKSTSPKNRDFLDSPCYEPWLWPKIEANGEVWPCSTIQMKVNIKQKSFKEIWYGKEFNKFRERIIKKDLPPECENCVSTHIPLNREIRKKLIELVKEWH